MAESSTLREESNAVGAGGNDPASSSATASSPTCENQQSNNSRSDEAPGTSSGSEPESILLEEGDAVFKQLARQIEYYFSTENLAKDTYVETLRSLNDGFVPISIIANFGKVRMLVPYDGINAVQEAAANFSTLLEVATIDTKTGKKVSGDEGENNASTLLAVGPVSGKPIPISELCPLQPGAPSTPPTSSAVQNTIILREVPSAVEEENVRELFAFEGCPPVQSVRLEVANCW